MTQSNQPSDRNLAKRLEVVEFRLTRLENNQRQLEDSMVPGGYITEAFDRIVEDIDELKAQNARMEGKIDLILRKMSGEITIED
jgi:hypothetical protein